MKIIIIMFLAFGFTGCVMIDRNVSRVQPVSAEISDFSGEFAARASYRSTYSGGLHESDRIEDYIPFDEPIGRDDLDFFRVTIPSEGTLRIEGVSDESVGSGVELKEESDFRISGGIIRLSTERMGPGTDYPGLLVGSRSVQLALDEAGSLTLFHRQKGGGFFTIFPVAMAGRGMAVFPRRTIGAQQISDGNAEKPSGVERES